MENFEDLFDKALKAEILEPFTSKQESQNYSQQIFYGIITRKVQQNYLDEIVKLIERWVNVPNQKKVKVCSEKSDQVHLFIEIYGDMTTQEYIHYLQHQYYQYGEGDNKVPIFFSFEKNLQSMIDFKKAAIESKIRLKDLYFQNPSEIQDIAEYGIYEQEQEDQNYYFIKNSIVEKRSNQFLQFYNINISRMKDVDYYNICILITSFLNKNQFQLGKSQSIYFGINFKKHYYILEGQLLSQSQIDTFYNKLKETLLQKTNIPEEKISQMISIQNYQVIYQLQNQDDEEQDEFQFYRLMNFQDRYHRIFKIDIQKTNPRNLYFIKSKIEQKYEITQYFQRIQSSNREILKDQMFSYIDNRISQQEFKNFLCNFSKYNQEALEQRDQLEKELEILYNKEKEIYQQFEQQNDK